MRRATRVGLLLTALSAAACSAPAVEQASCAFGVPRECFDGRDNGNRANRDDPADRTKLLAASAFDVTARDNRDDLANLASGRAGSVLDATARADRDDVTNRTKVMEVSARDASDRRDRDDTTNRTLVCP